MHLDKQAPDRLSKFLTFSVIGHIILVLVFAVTGYFVPDQPIIIQDAIRVDIVALPDKFVPDEGPPATIAKITPVTAPSPTQPTETSPPPTITLKEKQVPKDLESINLTKNKEKDSFSKLKQMSALDRIKAQLEKEKINKIQASPTPKAFKGNVITSGSDLTGLARLEADTYLKQVDRHIRQFWSLPDYLRRRSLKIEIVVKFDERGNILAKDVIRSSGNSIFDEIALAAVQKSSPVPPPPDKFVGLSSAQGFLFRFSE